MNKTCPPRNWYLALTLTDRETPQQIRKAVAGARRAVSLLLEIRIDRFRRLDQGYVLEKIRRFRSLGLPLIATIRNRREGGGWNLSDSKRFALFKKILPFVQIVDVELKSARLRKALIPLAHRKRKKVILSHHDFQRTPSDRVLGVLLQKARRAGADWVKIAVTPRRKSDVTRLLLFTGRHRRQNLITLSMGRLGESSRALAPVFGSKLTYSFVGRPQAPGQLPLPLLLRRMQQKGPGPFCAASKNIKN